MRGLRILPAFALLPLAAPSGALLADTLAPPVEALQARPQTHMAMTLKKGLLFIRVNVLTLDIRLGADSSARIGELLSGEITPAVEDSIADAAIRSRDALVSLEFLRDIDLDRFLSEARKATEKVWRRGFIDEAEYTRVDRNLPIWYASLAERGILRGDRMYYRIQGDRLHTVFQSPDGRIHVDQIDEGTEPRMAVLGGYFVRGSDFREGLLESLRRGRARP